MADTARTLRVDPIPPKLPVSKELSDLRKIAAQPNVNDLVEKVVVELWADEKYQRLIYGVFDSQTVEGSLAADNYMAASMIREKAKALGLLQLVRENLQTINLSHGVVLRRYGQSRKERRNMIGGEIVPGGERTDNTGK